MKPCFDLTGMKFGKWEVMELSDPPITVKCDRNKLYWLCKCDCGYEGIVMGTKLRIGKSKSCGCSMLVRKVVSR